MSRVLSALFTASLVFMLSACVSTSPHPQDTPRGQAPAEPAPWIHGVTIDAITPLDAIRQSLSQLSRRPTARIVFDENVPASSYTAAVKALHPVADLMGEILDSYYVKATSVDAYSARTADYLATLGADIDIWEVGNEINGEWVGQTSDAVAKISSAYDQVKARGKRAALTLYYNQDCWSKPENEMFRWAEANVPARMRSGLDFVWISYYEEDCNFLRPDWPSVFGRLASLFPNSRIGFGETGSRDASKKREVLERYYGMHIPEPRYVGGHFWWYFRQDMVPETQPLWPALNEQFSISASGT
jgi:hypothetical protein